MQYRLRSLILILTVASLVFAWWNHRAHQRRQEEARLATFFELRSHVEGFEDPLREHVLGIPEVMEQLKRVSPRSPAIALGHGIMGSSMSVGDDIHFEREYRFSWQTEDGSQNPGIYFKVRSDYQANLSPSDPHRVVITPMTDTDLNKRVIQWYLEQLQPYKLTEFVLIETTAE